MKTYIELLQIHEFIDQDEMIPVIEIHQYYIHVVKMIINRVEMNILIPLREEDQMGTNILLLGILLDQLFVLKRLHL